MNVGLYRGAAAMQALEQWQESVSQNLSAASVPGYKKTEVNFDLTSAEKTNPALAARQAGAAMPSAHRSVDFSPGEVKATGQPTDLAIQGSGFFQVKAADGQPAYTRDGEFHAGADGNLVNKMGYPVLGQDGSPIHTELKDGPVAIGADGKVSQGTKQIGQVGVFDFSDPSHLQRVEGGLFRSDQDKATAVEKPQIASGFLEGSNVSPLRSMVELIAVQRAYEANQKAISSHDQRIGQAISMLGNPSA